MSQPYFKKVGFMKDRNRVNITFNIGLVEKIVSQLKRGKAAGEDNISCEHLQFSHPIVLSLITRLFNLMLKFGYVPDAFGRGIVIPIPKGDKRVNNCVEDYRGITLSSIFSKVFEHCILWTCKDYFTSSDRQFGFKKNTGCLHAIYTLNKTVNYFTSKNATVNLCALDLTKAFDRIDHSILFDKLIKKGFPFLIIEVLVNWYDKLFSVVKWGNALSEQFQILAGVRQGGVLSPLLFNIMVNEVLTELEKSKRGCFIKNICANSIMYADDLML